jgi:hypothetical protein
MAAHRDEYRNLAEQQGLEDPVLFQHKLLSDDKISVGLRATIAAAISPYYRPKLGLQSPPRMIEMKLEVPDFQTVEEAESFLIKIAALVGSGVLSLPTALDLSTLVRNWILSKHAALFAAPSRIILVLSRLMAHFRPNSNNCCKYRSGLIVSVSGHRLV